MVEFLSLVAQVLISVFGILFLTAVILTFGELWNTKDRNHDDTL